MINFKCLRLCFVFLHILYVFGHVLRKRTKIYLFSRFYLSYSSEIMFHQNEEKRLIPLTPENFHIRVDLGAEDRCVCVSHWWTKNLAVPISIDATLPRPPGTTHTWRHPSQWRPVDTGDLCGFQALPSYQWHSSPLSCSCCHCCLCLRS